MIGTVKEPILSELAEQTDVPFNRVRLKEIYLMIDDDSFQRISRRAKIDVFDDVGGTYRQPETVRSAPPEKKKGGLLFACLSIFWL